MSASPSRRGIMGGAGLLAVGAVAPLTAGSRPMGNDQAFQALLDRLQQLEAQEKAFHQNVFTPRRRRFEKLRDAVPHASITYTNVLEKPHALTTREGAAVAAALVKAERRLFATMPRHERLAKRAEITQQMRDFRAKQLRRDRHIEKLAKDTGFAEAEDRSFAMIDEINAAQEAVIRHPVTSAADLVRKMDVISAAQEWDWKGTHEALVADAKRIAAL